MDDHGTREGVTRPVTAPPNHHEYEGRHRRRAAAPVATIRARRAGLREHGSQAARSKRGRPGRAHEVPTGWARPHRMRRLDPLEEDSAAHQ